MSQAGKLTRARQAAGRTGIVAVVGSSELNVGMLNFQARRSIDDITEHAADFEKWASAQRKSTATVSAPAAEPDAAALPTRLQRAN